MAGQITGVRNLSLGSIKQPEDLVDADRQCAWELYVEMATRVAVTGKVTDPTAADFGGEVLSESLQSLYAFLLEARALMRRLPVGKLGARSQESLGALVIHQAVLGVLRPFLEHWQAGLRHWWQQEADPCLAPMVRQAGYPGHGELLADWTRLRLTMRSIQAQLAQVYGFVDLGAPTAAQ